jgi:putative transposase
MMGTVHLLPGTTFSSVSDKGSYASEERATLTLAKLERWLAIQIAGVYHLSIHSAIGKTPLAAWQEDAETAARPRDPLDETEFFLSFLPAVPRQIRRDGIHFYNIRYWDNVLSPWAGRLREPLLVKYDPRNLSRIYVQDPCGRHWPVPYADLRQPPIALWEIEAVNKQARQDGLRMNSAGAIFANILEQRQLVRQAGSLSKQRRLSQRTDRLCLLYNLHLPTTLCARSLGVGLSCPALLSCSQEPAQIGLSNVWRRRPTSLRRSGCSVNSLLELRNRFNRPRFWFARRAR